MTNIFFNLLINSIFSMFTGLLIVGFFIWFFRIENGPWKLFLLSLPFVKIIFDCLRGLPSDSVLLSGIDPFSLPPKHQFLRAGLGFSYLTPTFHFIFSVRDTLGREFAASVGDYLVIWFTRNFGTQVPLIILGIALVGSSVLLVIRILSFLRFERRRKVDRLEARSLSSKKLYSRVIDIYVSERFSGTPFTGGILSPYICVPQDAYNELTPSELEAVIAHEVGHIRQIDLVGTVIIQFLGDVFWFVPGYRWLSRKIDRLRELLADQWAVKSGIKPELLASALVKLRETPQTQDKFIIYSAFYREKSLLKIRIEHLLGKREKKGPRFGWGKAWVRLAVSLGILMAVMSSVFGGNHSRVSLKNPEWFNSLLNCAGLEAMSIDN